ncbi:hypothetical protein [Sporosarcina sp. HYO08]|uniref:hypothetical protein n=1 Tax=Sporosarcina sp. HYO08 TaxID=1759557 RepID=UPI00079A5EF7|nr:hypothetical protein [Sporosarcina sp. HYO08]KXH87299.1 hypothetical protein AU377_01620 [Sporosarcina sp. HYO08]
MESKKWKMQETFAFPEHVGMPISAESIKITPGYTEKRTNDSIRLSGIYHIAVNLNFDNEQTVEEIPESAVFVGDVEVAENTGYFEYAVPLNIDLPADVQGPLHVSATDATYETDGQGSLNVIWNVECLQQAKVEDVAAEVQEEEMTAAQEEVTPSTEIALVEEAENVEANAAQAEENFETAEAMADDFKEEANAEADEAPKAVVTHSTPYSEEDEALAFIAGLGDGISTSTFRSNDIFVQNKS